MRTYEVGGVRVAEAAPDGPMLASEQDALDLLGEVLGAQIDVVAVPARRFSPDFFKLRTTLLGGFVQKFQIYRVRLAVVGDISAHVAASSALRDFVHESNRLGQVLFVRDGAELAERL